jgi:hypothetical protein
MGNENASADNEEESGNCFQHSNESYGPAVGPNCTRRYTVKGIPKEAEFLKRDDDFLQHVVRLVSGSIVASQGQPLEKSGSDVEAERYHVEGGQQADAAKECYDLERLSITLRLHGLTHQNGCYNRVHGGPLRLDATLIPGVRFKVVSRVSKMVSSEPATPRTDSENKPRSAMLRPCCVE